MSEHVISGLARKRAELAGEIEATHKRLSQMIADLGNIDATLWVASSPTMIVPRLTVFSTIFTPSASL